MQCTISSTWSSLFLTFCYLCASSVSIAREVAWRTVINSVNIEAFIIFADSFSIQIRFYTICVTLALIKHFDTILF
jgi:hypothetical protein